MHKALLLACLMCGWGILRLHAQSQCSIAHFDELSGMDQWLVTQIVQDRQGMIWVATWNGLTRYDGYQFETFKSQVGDGVEMPSDRMRDLMLDDEGRSPGENLLCKIEDRVLLFNTQSCRYSSLPPAREKAALARLQKRLELSAIGKDDSFEFNDRFGQRWRVRRDGALFWRDSVGGQWVPYPSDIKPVSYLDYGITDRQGNVWLRSGNGLYRLTFSQQHYRQIPQEKPTRVRATCLDDKQRYWVTTNDDATVRLYDKENRLLGYLGRDGQLHPGYVSFGSFIYHVMQDSRGTFWLSSKPDGLFRLTEQGDGRFAVEQFCHDVADKTSPGGNQLYYTSEDPQGRLWVATFDDGLECIENPRAQRLSFLNRSNGLDQPDGGTPFRVRQVYITRQGILLAATTAGLLVGDVSKKDVRSVRFRLHQRDAHRSASLSNNAVMYVMEDSRHRLFVCTESGGLNQIQTDDLLSDQLDFRHFDTHTGLPSDIIMSAIEDQNGLLLVSNNQLIRLNPDDNTSIGFDIHFWQRPFRFTDAIPLRLPDGRWLFGLHDGAFTIRPSDIRKSSFVPPIALTSLSVQNGIPDRAVNALDTLTLLPPDRNITLTFSALDYAGGGDILYAFQMGRSQAWNQIGKSRSVTFLDLDPGTYRLRLRSTNSDGVWVDNIRTLTIIVKPTFWETPWAKLLYLLILIAIAYAVLRTRRHIRNLKQQQRELHEAYLALLSQQEATEAAVAVIEKEPAPAVPQLKPEDEAFMQRAVKFIEEHIGDSDINIGDMADATATSRSGLHRKMKSLLGVTPLDFIREARIRKACQMLCGGSAVNDVAYACGFSDPKYFAKSFKTQMGMTPTEYKVQNSAS